MDVMNKNLVNRFATTTLAALVLAAPAIALAPTAAAETAPVAPITVTAEDGQVAAVTLPATIDRSELTRPAPVTAVPLPATIGDEDVVETGVYPLEIETTDEDGNPVTVVTLPATIDRSELTRPAPVTAVPLPATIDRSELTRPAPVAAVALPGTLDVTAVALPADLDPQPVVVDDLDPELGIVAISAVIDPEVFNCEDLDESVRVPVEGEDGLCTVDRSGLARDDVRPMDVPGLDQNLGIMPVAGTVSTQAGNNTAATWLSVGLSAVAAISSVALLATRRHATVR